VFGCTHPGRCRVDLDKGYNLLLSDSCLFTIHDRGHGTVRMAWVRNLGVKFPVGQIHTSADVTAYIMFRYHLDRKRKGTQGGSGLDERDRTLPVQPLLFALVIGWRCVCRLHAVVCFTATVIARSGVLLCVFDCILRIAVCTGAILLLL
jgi:hypothetical protein